MTKPIPASVLNKVPTGSGAGINADEADSMMQSLAQHRNKLADSMIRLLDSIKKEHDDVGDVVLTNRQALIHLAYLVTGRWGGKQSPHKTGKDTGPSHAKFIGRMQELHQSLAFMIEEINRTKPYSVKKSGGKTRNPWIRGIDGGKPGGLIICYQAVDYVLRKGIANRSIFQNGLPFGLQWGILAKGNGKLPFMAYSELPMATCPGAGECAVWPNQSGWCYSFKAWRYPDAFARQFLNTLANTADDAVAQLRGGKAVSKINPPRPAPVKKFAGSSYLPAGKRMWPDYIKWLLLYQTRSLRTSKPVFFRLFVDGDVNNARSVVEWMQICHDINRGRAATQVYKSKGKKLHHVEVYGYSKAWPEFLAASRQMRSWPTNYTLNLSGGSKWWNVPKVRNAIERLPIARGYFTAVNLHGALLEFKDKFSGHILTDKMSDSAAVKRIESFAAINKFTSENATWQMVNDLARRLGIKTPDRKGKDGDPVSIEQARGALFKNWIDHLLGDNTYAKAAAREIVKDGRAKTVAAALKSKKAMRDKIIAMHLHEVLWAFGAGGSCPLVCGNCFDHPDPDAKGVVHRCASTPGRLFGRTPSNQLGATIHIGLH